MDLEEKAHLEEINHFGENFSGKDSPLKDSKKFVWQETVIMKRKISKISRDFKFPIEHY